MLSRLGRGHRAGHRRTEFGSQVWDFDPILLVCMAVLLIRV